MSGYLRGAAAALALAAGFVCTGRAAAAPVVGAFGSGSRVQSASSVCVPTARLTCTSVDVPLDWSGRTPGTISLHVERLTPLGRSKGVLFLVAGGPGQASSATFALGSKDWQKIYSVLFPGYTLVAYDDRGTGRSGYLDCSGASSARTEAEYAAACASSIGERRDFYTTADHAEDLEAVRASVGADRIAIWGVSYGTKLALAYAHAHPTHVERLLLDSIVDADTPDPLDATILRAMPTALAAICAGGSCKGATNDFPGDVVAFAARLAQSPQDGLTAAGFLGFVVAADLDPGLAAELPAAVHAALGGRLEPLFHLAGLGRPESEATAMAPGLFVATVCGDGEFPWAGTVADRERALAADAAAAPAGALGPFGAWAAGFGNAQLCVGWPQRLAPPPAAPAGALPDVPVLALSGSLDMRTPTANAVAVLSHFPQGRLLVVPGVGHSVLTADPSGCALIAVRTWIAGGVPSVACRRVKPYVAPLAAFPVPVHGRLDARRTRELALRTVREAEAAWLSAATASGTKVRGLAGGTLVAKDSVLVLDRYSIVKGVAVSGRLKVFDFGPPVAFRGTMTVGGSESIRLTLPIR
jgi:pimeloyl-ACP methyl ester carboxylesterase